MRHSRFLHIFINHFVLCLIITETIVVVVENSLWVFKGRTLGPDFKHPQGGSQVNRKKGKYDVWVGIA